MFIVEAVPSDHIHHVWTDAWPWLERAIDRFPDVTHPWSQSRLYPALLTGHAQLWIAWDVEADTLAGVVVTEIRPHNDMMLLAIPLVGGRQLMKWGKDLWSLLKLFGRANGCTHAVGYGRGGWKRFCRMIEVGKTDDGVTVMGCPLREN